MAALDLNSLKDYVQGGVIPGSREGTVLLHISHSNLKHHFSELRFDLHASVEGMKKRLQMHTGTADSSMSLQLFDASDRLLVPSMDNGRPLGFYSPLDGYRIHIIDLDPTSASSGGWLEDTSLVEKYVMPDEKYDQLDNSVRKFKQKLLAERPDLVPLQKEKDDYMKELAAQISVGQRCEVDAGEKRGEVAFVGRVEGLPAGFWIGVRFDEPVGKNNGSVNGVVYFSCPPKHGSFVRPDMLKVGDYPERDLFGDDPDEI